MTNQEIFDKVLFHLRRQGVQAVEGNSCAYRAENGNMCAVGCLIPDDVYDPTIEGKTVWELIHGDPYFTAPLRDTLDDIGIQPNQYKLLDELQDAHDDLMPELEGKPLDMWEEAMRDIATQFNLEYKESSCA